MNIELKTWRDLVNTCTRWSITTTNKNRDALIEELSKKSGRCVFGPFGDAPTHQSATRAQLNSDA